MAHSARLRNPARGTTGSGVVLLLALVGLTACPGAEETPPPVNPPKAAAPLEPWRTQENDAFAEAKRSGRHVMVDFKADWCEPCKKVEAVLAEENVRRELTEHFVPLALDISDLTYTDNELKAKYKVFDLPAVIFVDVEGRELGRFEGQADPATHLVAAAREVVAQSPPKG